MESTISNPDADKWKMLKECDTYRNGKWEKAYIYENQDGDWHIAYDIKEDDKSPIFSGGERDAIELNMNRSIVSLIEAR